MDKKASRKSPAERMFTRLHVGCVYMRRHPQLYAILATYLIIICIIAAAVMQPAVGDAFAVLAHNITRVIFPLYAIAGLLALIIVFGMPRGAIRASKALARAGIVNSAGESPMLLSVQRDKKNWRRYRYEFDANSLSLTFWQDHQIDIEAALNVNIAQITTSRGKHRIWIFCVPATDALPDLVTPKLSDFPKSASQLALGQGLVGPVVADLQKIPHILIGGSTGSGKTLLLKLILAQLIRNGAVVHIADFKGGVDYPTQWAESCDIITDESTLIHTLDAIVDELNSRKELLRFCGQPNIAVYNRSAATPIPRIVFACDEVAELLDKTGAGKERKEQIGQIESYLSTIARQGRAFGIHLILATQRPDANILPGQIKNNMDYRICGRADQVLSQIILDSTIAADEIPKDVQGRFIDNEGRLFQAYYLSDDQLEGLL